MLNFDGDFDVYRHDDITCQRLQRKAGIFWSLIWVASENSCDHLLCFIHTGIDRLRDQDRLLRNYIVSGSLSVWTLLCSFIQVIYFSVPNYLSKILYLSKSAKHERKRFAFTFAFDHCEQSPWCCWLTIILDVYPLFIEMARTNISTVECFISVCFGIVLWCDPEMGEE